MAFLRTLLLLSIVLPIAKASISGLLSQELHLPYNEMYLANAHLPAKFSTDMERLGSDKGADIAETSSTKANNDLACTVLDHLDPQPVVGVL